MSDDSLPERVWIPTDEPVTDVGFQVGDHLKADRLWIQQHPIVKQTYNVLLVRFVDNADLTDLLYQIQDHYHAKLQFMVVVMHPQPLHRGSVRGLREYHGWAQGIAHIYLDPEVELK